MQIRIASPRDSTDIAALHALSWRTSYRGILEDEYLDGRVLSERTSVWRERLLSPRAEQYVIVAEDQDGLAGFACAYGSADEQWGTMLDNLHARPSRQGRGTGSKLISEVAAWSFRSFPGRDSFSGSLNKTQGLGVFMSAWGESSLERPSGSLLKEPLSLSCGMRGVNRKN